MTIPLLTLNSLANRVGLPVATVFRRVRKLGIEPDFVTVERRKPPTQLFRIERLPDLRHQLTIS